MFKKMKRKPSEEEVDYMVRNVVANMALSGFEMSPEEVEILKEIARGNISAKKYRRQVIKRYKKAKDK